MFAFFRPAAHQAPLPEEKIDSTYRRLRWQIFAGIFFGYAGYYLLRKNFSLAMPYLIDEGYTRGELGLAMSAIAIAYGLSKFLMGLVSGPLQPALFPALWPTGFGGGDVHFRFRALGNVQRDHDVHFAVHQRLGPGHGLRLPSGRTMVHWWSQKERGGVVSVWNVAHNVGGGLIGPLFLLGMAWFNDWHAAFYVPATVALAVAAFAFITMATPRNRWACRLSRNTRTTTQKATTPATKTNSAPRKFSSNTLRNKIALVHRLCQRVCLSAALRRTGLGADLFERSQALHGR